MKTLTVHKQKPPGEKPQKLNALHIVVGLVARLELDKRFLCTKTKRPYSLESLYKVLNDKCEEVNVIGEEKFY